MDDGQRVDEVEWEEGAGKRWKKWKRDIGGEALVAGNLGRVMGRDSGAPGSPAALHLQPPAPAEAGAGADAWASSAGKCHSASAACHASPRPRATGVLARWVRPAHARAMKPEPAVAGRDGDTYCKTDGNTMYYERISPGPGWLVRGGQGYKCPTA